MSQGLVKVGPDIFLRAPDARVLQQIQSGGEYLPSASNLDDLITLAFLLADEDFSKGRELAKKIVDRSAPMVLLPSSSLVDSTNQNHLKKNPFRR